jgi:amino acid permease
MRLEFAGTVFLMAALILILGAAIPHVQAANMPLLNWVDPIIPYGVILFSLAGMTAVPELEQAVDGRRDDYRRAIIRGTLIAAAFTLAFGLIVWGVSGAAVTEDAVSGLQAVLGSKVALPAAVIGFLAVATSYFATAANIKDSFLYDFRYHLNTAWLLAVVPPIIVFLFGGRDFINLIGFSGAVFGGIMSVLVGLMYLSIRRRRLVKRHPLRVHPAITYVTMAVLGLGVLVELYDYLKRLLLA